ncbi:hypothetical protein B0I37DRAFT_332191 [Chaetomium sp. MPI-CAGE-AT-0009]|nr:hypothetical protein B0I37DRAFT_332191 [Chaetomium sp. MPI-CAGE-AT-0009]
MSQQQFSSIKLDKRGRQQMIIYLENANPANLSVSQWGVSTWQAAHGEGRSASSTTFHVGVRFSGGSYFTCILVQSRAGDQAVEGTIINWGTTAPNLPEVLRTYQRTYLKTAAPASQTPAQDPSNNNGGGGAGGSGGGSGSGSGGGPAWEKKVCKDDYGGYYYMDENDEYCACDDKGNQLKTTTAHGRTTNPYGILLVFLSSKREPFLYSNNKRIPCQPQQDPTTRHYFIVDSSKRKRNVQIYGSLPKWKVSRAQAAAQPAPQPSKTPSKNPSSKTPAANNPSKAPAPRQPLQEIQYMTDPKSGRKYYVGTDGQTHWAK